MSTRSPKWDDERNEERARDLLAPLYGERDQLSPREAAELEAVRDLIQDFAGGHLGPEESPEPKLSNALLAALEKPAEDFATLSPQGDGVWLTRNEGIASLPVSEPVEFSSGAMIATDGESRADVTVELLSLALNCQSELAVDALDSEHMVGRMGHGCVYFSIDNYGTFENFEVTIETPQGSLRARSGQVEIEVEEAGYVRVLVAQGKARFTTTGGKSRSVREGHELRILAGRMSLSRLGFERIEEEMTWARMPVRRPRIFEAIGAFFMAAFFIGVAVVRIADASAPLPPVETPFVPAASQILARDLAREIQANEPRIEAEEVVEENHES